jgi:hypothetical protein
MSTPRERMLPDVIRNMLIGVQKSEQINKKMSSWREKIIQMNDKEIVKCATIVSQRVCDYAKETETKNKKTLSFIQLKNKIIKELEIYNG